MLRMAQVGAGLADECLWGPGLVSVSPEACWLPDQHQLERLFPHTRVFSALDKAANRCGFTSLVGRCAVSRTYLPHSHLVRCGHWHSGQALHAHIEPGARGREVSPP